MLQERKKRRIVLASILKPVDDTRMFEKMGRSLASGGLYEVFILGYPSPSVPDIPSIHFLPSDPFPRLSIRRMVASWKAFLKIWKLNPSILIFNTHELLIEAIVLKVCLGTRIVYDIRENYYRNIIHSGSFPLFVRVPLALLVRFKEKFLAPTIDHFMLAEIEYESEFKFHRGGWTVVENKALTPTLSRGEGGPPFRRVVRGESRGAIKLLFSGTLADSTGVFMAIEIAKQLHRLDPEVRLKIIGRAALERVKQRIQHEIQDFDFIMLVGGDNLVPHEEILRAIEASDAGIISYPRSPHTENSHPTKLFEYLNAQLPIILEPHWPWVTRYEKHQPFILIDFSKPDYKALLQQLRTGHFYITAPIDITWTSEEPKLLRLIANL